MNDVKVKCECGAILSLQPNTEGTVFSSDWTESLRTTHECPECSALLAVYITSGMADPEHAYKDKKWLTKAYVKEGRTMSDIATSCGVTAMTIHNWLRRFNIETRRRGRPEP